MKHKSRPELVQGEFYSLTIEGVKEVLAERMEKREGLLRKLGEANSRLEEVEQAMETGKTKGTSLDGVHAVNLRTIRIGRNYERVLIEAEVRDINRTIARLEQVIKNFEQEA